MLSEPSSPFRAHGTSFPKLEIVENPPLLRIHGVEIDTVETSSLPFAAGAFQVQSPLLNNEAIIEYLWREICGRDHFNLESRYINGESSFYAYMQTLAYGCAQMARRERVPYNQIPKSRWLREAALYLIDAVINEDLIDSDLREIAENARKEHDEEQWGWCANGAAEYRALARTKKGYYVLGSELMAKNDIICVLYGGKLPFCLQSWKDQQYLLVGECYVHGFMDGAAIQMAEWQEASEKIFDII